MPELPEVEIFKQYFDASSLHQVIEKVEVTNFRILGNVTEQELHERLPGHQFLSSQRHGKYLLVRSDGNFWLTFHFGMSGHFAFFTDLTNMPAHTRFLVTFDNGSHLAFRCPRMFGKVGLVDDMDTFLEEKKLGPDALSINYSTFNSIFKKRTGMIKSILMNQQVIAGIGNLYADEILFQTRIHPTTTVDTLDKSARKQVFDVMKTILQTSIKAKTELSKLPKSYLLSNREKEASCPRCKSKLEITKAAGRTTYYCPKCQIYPS